MSKQCSTKYDRFDRAMAVMTVLGPPRRISTREINLMDAGHVVADKSWFAPEIRQEIEALEQDSAAQCAMVLRFMYLDWDHVDELVTIVDHYDGLEDDIPTPGAARVAKELICG